MKILSIPQIKEADIYTINKEPIRSTDLMERAGTNCYKWIAGNFNRDKKIINTAAWVITEATDW